MESSPRLLCLTGLSLCLVLAMPLVGQTQNGLPAATDRIADINGIRLHWTGEWWDSLFPTFARDHRVIVVDLPGHGRSTNHRGPWSYRQVASDMYALLDSLGVQRVRAIGHSAGGITLLHMATQQPARMEAMVLIAGGHRLLESARKYGREITFEGLPDSARTALVRAQPGGEAQVRSLFDILHSIADDYEDLSSERISQIRARTLLVWGNRDPWYPIEVAVELYQAIPNAVLWVVPSEGHFPLWPDWGGSTEAAGDFPVVVTRFLSNSK